jgi:hypothetical protein
MSKSRDLAHLDVFDAPWTDAIQEAISVAAPNLRLQVVNATTLRAVAGTVNDQAVAFVGGLWRWRTTNQDITPSGGAGVYELWLAASANENVSATVDNTDYNYYLYVRASGSGPPTGNTPAAKAITQTRKVGELDWSGTAITGIRQWVGVWDSRDPITPTQPLTNIPAARFRGVASSSGNIAQVEDSTGAVKWGVDATGLIAGVALTLSSTLAVTGVATFSGNLTLGAAVVATWGGDTNLYRASANVLKTDDALQTVGDITALAGAALRTQQASGNVVLANKLLVGDANNAFQANGLGKLEWGPGGASVLDVNLYRGGVDILQTDDYFVAQRGSAANASLGATVTGDTTYRLQILADGKIQWGPGTAGGADTNLYRDPAGNKLVTDDTFSAPALQISGTALASTHLSDTAALARLAGPAFTGTPTAPTAAPGTNTTQLATTAFVVAADALKANLASPAFTGNVTLVSAAGVGIDVTVASGSPGMTVRRTADANARFTIDSAGALAWGPGTGVTDTLFFRTGVNWLQTTGIVEAQGGLATKVNAGAVSDASFTNVPPSGALALDTTNFKLYARFGSTWKSITLT